MIDGCTNHMGAYARAHVHAWFTVAVLWFVEIEMLARVFCGCCVLSPALSLALQFRVQSHSHTNRRRRFCVVFTPEVLVDVNVQTRMKCITPSHATTTTAAWITCAYTTVPTSAANCS